MWQFIAIIFKLKIIILINRDFKNFNAIIFKSKIVLAIFSKLSNIILILNIAIFYNKQQLRRRPAFQTMNNNNNNKAVRIFSFIGKPDRKNYEIHRQLETFKLLGFLYITRERPIEINSLRV